MYRLVRSPANASVLFVSCGHGTEARRRPLHGSDTPPVPSLVPCPSLIQCGLPPSSGCFARMGASISAVMSREPRPASGFGV